MPIHRVVKMTFKPDNLKDFLLVFEESKDKIRARSGCLSLQLIQDIERPNILSTSSIWESQNDLEDYRNSELFIETWRKTKIHFEEKAEAKSYEILYWLP
jgi:heme oxygenase (mycobilin-producing)